MRSAPRESVLAEAGLRLMRELADGGAVLELDKCRRVAATNLRTEWGLRTVWNRLMWDRWRRMAEK